MKSKKSKIISRYKLPAWTSFEVFKPDNAEEEFEYTAGAQPQIFFQNSHYKVAVYKNDHIIHLIITTCVGNIVRDWEDIQRIKNEIAGSEFEAVELFPAETRRIRVIEFTHIWCLPKKGRWPIGFNLAMGREKEGHVEVPTAEKPAPDLGEILKNTEKVVFQKALETTDGNKTKAAELVGMTRGTFLRRLKKYQEDS